MFAFALKNTRARYSEAVRSAVQKGPQSSGSPLTFKKVFTGFATTMAVSGVVALVVADEAAHSGFADKIDPAKESLEAKFMRTTTNILKQREQKNASSNFVQLFSLENTASILGKTANKESSDES